MSQITDQNAQLAAFMKTDSAPGFNSPFGGSSYSGATTIPNYSVGGSGASSSAPTLASILSNPHPASASGIANVFAYNSNQQASAAQQQQQQQQQPQQQQQQSPLQPAPTYADAIRAAAQAGAGTGGTTLPGGRVTGANAVRLVLIRSTCQRQLLWAGKYFPVEELWVALRNTIPTAKPDTKADLPPA